MSVLLSKDREELLAFLGRDREGTLYLRSLVHEYGVASTRRVEHGRFLGGFRSGHLVSVVFLGNSRNFTTFGPNADLGPVLEQALGRSEVPRLFVGPAENAGPVRSALLRHGAEPYLDRPQAYYVLTPRALVPAGPIGIRPATSRETEAVARAQAAMTEEDLLIPRHRIDLKRLRDISRRRIRAGKVWVVTEGDRLVFKTEESARTGDGILVGGVYTDPERRGQGLATRGIAAWAGRLFADGLEMIVLHVNADNRSAIRAYERVGFRRHAMLRLMLAC